MSHLCRLFFWQYFFSRHLRFMTTAEHRNKDWFKKLKVLHSLKAPVSSPRSSKAHAELRLLYISVYQSLCSDFRHLWIPFQGTCTSPPDVVYFRSLAENTALSILRDTIPQSSQSWFSFLLGRTQRETDQMRAENPVANIDACSRLPIRPQEANSPSYSCQQWHLCRRVCYYQLNSYRPGLFKFFGRDHMSYCTTVWGPDILRNVTFSGYTTFY